ncbi:replication-associated recombination protein A [Actinocatenispora thailandica]|uniref:replication-associated recombination protein A n=1 Tax=Actinocatenispora thailandica TaxID=227318 RepID=UPI001EF2ED5E|nr:replication-associated recombination protein A [Actinocatenispora thailandica]
MPGSAQPEPAQPSADAPLAVRMRPRDIDELVGQDHLRAAGAPLRRLVEGDAPLSVILWGPPGSGKTTIAHLVAAATNRRFVALSALSSGVKEVREVIATARAARRRGGDPTVLFIDEVHRFTKTQQDSLLAAVEDRTVTLLAATTENPYFSVVSPLLSRCVLLTLQQLGSESVRELVRRAVVDERGLAGRVRLAREAEDHLVRLSGGDARKALTALEAAAGSALATSAGGSGPATTDPAGTEPVEPVEIDLDTAEAAVDTAAVRYDRDGDGHYDISSALIKSLRGSDVDAALHWFARMIVAGEDPRFIARRLIIFASEDVGMADPQALPVAVAAAEALDRVGLPEAKLNLGQAVVHLATAPKSNSVTAAVGAAIADVQSGRTGLVPRALRDAHYSGARGLGHGTGYRYPHDDPRGVVTQQYPPDEAAGRDYYTPTRHGAERAVADRLPKIRQIVRGAATPPGAGSLSEVREPDAKAAGADSPKPDASPDTGGAGR